MCDDMLFPAQCSQDGFCDICGECESTACSEDLCWDGSARTENNGECCACMSDTYVVVIGSGGGPTTATVDIPNLNCPDTVDINNWLGTDTYGDWFTITSVGYEVTATRQ